MIQVVLEPMSLVASLILEVQKMVGLMELVVNTLAQLDHLALDNTCLGFLDLVILLLVLDI